MTRINKIVMHGFKSFAKRTEMLFNDNYNCVLGPNGSGKSNVIDALCFVLGKSSAKSLRVEKASNLIYNGGKKKNPAKFAEVSIYFDNQHKLFPVEHSEIKISRIVKEKGQSVYKINDKTMTREQILDTLSAAKINPDGYNIILQGDIVRFVEQPPQERRQLIEEISGISIYEDKKQKALRELDNVDARLKEAEIILTERETHLKELKHDRDQALKYKEMSDKIKECKASLVAVQIDRKDSEKQNIDEKLTDSNKKFESLKAEIEKLKKDIESKRSEIESINHEIEVKGEKGQLELNKHIENLRIDITKINSRIDTCNNEVQKITERKKNLAEEVENIQDKIKQLSEKKTWNEKQKSSVLKEKGILEIKIKQLKEKHNLDSIGDIEKLIEEIDKKADEMQREINSQREKQHELIREKDRIAYLVSTTEENIKKVINIEKEHHDQITKLKEMRENFKKSTLDLNKALDYDSTLSRQVAISKDSLRKAEEELAKLNARAVGIREMAYGDRAVQAIIEGKDKLKGIHGTIAELGHVDARFSLALEIAAGPRLKSIVVDNDETAARAIRYLKENKLGIATFLPLNKVRGRSASPEVKKLIDSRGCHGLAIDLVKFDDRYRNAFSYIFGDTLVVESIDTARRIGIGSARMVTLEGDLAETSGAMQGGFRDKKRQGIGFKEKELTENISQLEVKKAEYEGQLAGIENARAENEKKISNLRGSKAILEAEIIKMEKSMHLDSGDLDATKQRQKQLNEELAKVEKDIEEISNSIMVKNRELAQLKIQKQTHRSKVSEIRDPKILAELNTFSQKISQFSEEVINLDAELRNIDSQISTILVPEKEKSSQIQKQLEKEEASFKSESIELVKTLKEKNSSLKTKEDEAKEFYAKFKNLFAKRSKIEETIRADEKCIEEKSENSRRIEIQNNTMSLKIAEINAQLSGLKYEFQQYEGVRIDKSRDEGSLKSEISRFEKLTQEIGSVNMRALEIYETVEREYNGLMEKKATLTKEKIDVLGMMSEIETKKTELFMRTFSTINDNFKRIFGMLSTKGDAYLQLENEQSPFEGGILVKVKITGSKFLDIRSLSGGEKTMTALAFIFSIQEYDPASFYILDEVDAALDKHNAEKLAKLIRKYSEKAQYVMISHNDGVISEANVLYGVSMNPDGISQIVSLKI